MSALAKFHRFHATIRNLERDERDARRHGSYETADVLKRALANFKGQMPATGGEGRA